MMIKLPSILDLEQAKLAKRVDRQKAGTTKLPHAWYRMTKNVTKTPAVLHYV